MKTAKKLTLLAFILTTVIVIARMPAQGQSTAIPTTHLILPEDLLKLIQASGQEKPLIFQVGSHMMYTQAHVPGAEYIGLVSSDAGLQKLRDRVKSLPRTKFIVLYCGCCPWSHCPNVKPADDALQSMGFTNVKIVHVSDNFGTDWVYKGYPIAKGE